MSIASTGMMAAALFSLKAPLPVCSSTLLVTQRNERQRCANYQLIFPGYGFHGDFFNGWDETVLANAVANGTQSCAWDLNGEPGAKRQIEDCHTLLEHKDSTARWSCLKYPAVYNEPDERSASTPGKTYHLC